jgi:glucose/arabinose dehydrogenase
MEVRRLTAIGLAALCGAGSTAAAQMLLTTERITADLNAPLCVAFPKGDFNRLFIAEQSGSGGVEDRADVRILKLATNTVNAMPFLSINGVQTGGELGLLGLAFHPDYANNGFFYVYYTRDNGVEGGESVIARYRVSASDPDRADPASRVVILSIQRPFSWHNGGWIGFGPDGYLYIGTGDAGDSRAAQDKSRLLGKMLRLDVDHPAPPLQYSVPPTNPFFGSPAARGEVWAYGLRNPWRCSFDRVTGDLYIADVGAATWEEVNVQPAGIGGQNYGWPCYEGPDEFDPFEECPAASSMTFPVHAYGHKKGCAIAGGYVYRGCAIPWLQGNYFFGDFCTASIWSFAYIPGQQPTVTDRTAELAPGGGQTIDYIACFGEDALGELYVVDQGGEIFKIKPRQFIGPDCNGNGVRDACDIASGFSTDLNGNGIPDECETPCYPDCNGDGVLGLADFGCFQTRFALGNMYADCNGDGVLNLADFGCFQTKFALGCP